MDSTMEYSYDGAAYVMYDGFFGPDPVFNALDFTGNHTLLVRYADDIMNGLPASLDTTLTFTTNPVTLSSIAITTPATKLIYTVGDMLDIAGMVVTGTYSDASTQIETITAANVTGFNSAAAVASQTLTVTVGGKTTTYTVEIKAAILAAPPVTNDDITNEVFGMTTAMEFSYDGGPYVIYDPTGTVNFDWINLEFDGFLGDHTLQVRYAAVGQTPASLVTTLTFTTNPLRPGPPVTNNDTDNTVSGMDSTMEYSYDGAAYVMYDGFFGPDPVFNALDFTGNHTLLVRYADDIMNGLPASLDTTLTFTTNP
ncbi:MAG: bacterial Ig-like domain-containing protein, partial [Gudongella sp.]|nr:bacterial Ig-like domain-containing protein [Gudongella sp.]